MTGGPLGSSPLAALPLGGASAPAQSLTAIAVASAEAFGPPVAVLVEYAPEGIASSEALGGAVVPQAGTSIGTAEAFGAPAVVLVEYASGVASAEVFGAPTAIGGGGQIPVDGVAAGIAINMVLAALAKRRQQRPAAIVLRAKAIPSEERFGLADIEIDESAEVDAWNDFILAAD
jgi:hypothetical protein